MHLGSPLIFAPLLVATVCCITDGNVISVKSPVPKEKVSFFEFETPLIVTTFPALSADAASSISTLQVYLP